jgi:hypothetical protein
LRNVSPILDNCAGHTHLDPLKSVHLELPSPNTLLLVQPMGKRITVNLKYLYNAKLVNYIREAIQENLLISSSAVNARIDLHKQQNLLPIAGEEYVVRPFRTALLTAVLHTQDLDVQNKPDSENDVIFESQRVRNYEKFTCKYVNLQFYNKYELCEEAIFEQISVKHQKIRKKIRFTRPSVNE